MSTKFKIASAVAFSAIFLPLVSFAQSSAPFEQTTAIFDGMKDIVEMLTPFFASLALLYFFWGLAKFILKAGDEEAREEGKLIMKWGIIALFVMVSIWGIILFIREELGGSFLYTGDSGVPGFDVDMNRR